MGENISSQQYANILWGKRELIPVQKKKKKAIETPSSEGLFHISKRTTQFLPKMNKLVSGRAVFSSFFILHFKKEKKNIAVQFKHPQLEFLNLLFEKSQV